MNHFCKITAVLLLTASLSISVPQATPEAHITGLPASASSAVVYITNDRQHAEATMYEVHNGCVDVFMPADSFVSVMAREH